MSSALVIVAVLAAVNPARLLLGLPDATPRARIALLTLTGAAGAVGAVTALLAIADPLLDALDVSPESLRIAAGVVLVVGGTRVLAVPQPSADPGLPGRWAALVPVLFPLLLTPELALVVLSAGADDRYGAALAGLTGAVAAGVAGVFAPRSGVADTVLVATSRLVGGVLVVVGVSYVVDGIRDV